MGSLKGGPLSHRRDCRMVEESVDESRVLAAHAGAALQLWMELNAAEAAVAAFGPTPEQLREETAEAERLATESGTPAKSAKVIGTLQHRWSDFLDVHGESYVCVALFEEEEGPTIELAVHFQVRRFRTLLV